MRRRFPSTSKRPPDFFDLLLHLVEKHDEFSRILGDFGNFHDLGTVGHSRTNLKRGELGAKLYSSSRTR